MRLQIYVVVAIATCCVDDKLIFVLLPWVVDIFYFIININSPFESAMACMCVCGFRVHFLCCVVCFKCVLLKYFFWVPSTLEMFAINCCWSQYKI